MSLQITPQLPAVSAFGTGVATSTGTIVLAAGNNITLNTGASSITIVGPSPGAGGFTMSHVQNYPLNLVGVNTVVTKAGTITGTAGVGSSLFLHRMLVPGTMNLSEIDTPMRISANATSDGAGTISRAMAIYSFGNSTSLASVMSFSGSSSWNTGTATVGASGSLTQFQGGWSNLYIQPMTFASSTLGAGEYVVGQLFDFAQATSTWTLSLFGMQGVSVISAITNVAGITTQGVTGGVAAGSGLTGISSYASQFLALSTAGSLSAFTFQGTVSTAASSQVLSVSTLQVTVTNSDKSCSFQLIGNKGNSNIISSLGTIAGSILTAGGTTTVLSTIAVTSNSQVLINQPTILAFVGSGSTSSGLSGQFVCGIMSTGAIPVSIALTSAAVTHTGGAAFRQPWLALVGS